MTKEDAKVLFGLFLDAQSKIDEADKTKAELEETRGLVLARIHEAFGSGPFSMKDGRQFSIAKREKTPAGALKEARYEIRFRGKPSKVMTIDSD